MKHFKVFFCVFVLLPSLAFGGSIRSNLRFINEQFKEYNKYESEFDVKRDQLVFKNEFSTAYIPFKDIDFRINYRHKSIDIYCLDGSNCIDKGDMTWDYYNVSLVDGDRMAKVIFEVLDKCREIRDEIIKREKTVYYGDNEKGWLNYINRQFDLYNKYYSRFEVEDDMLVFSNKFGTAKIPFSDIDFKVNPNTKSIEFHCKNGSKCIRKYDFDGDLTTWDYYNVSLVTDSDEMASVVYEVKERCDKLKAAHDNGGNNDDTPSGDDDIDDLLAYINRQFDRYNKYESSFRVDVRNKTLIFANEMSTADPLKFEDIGFRLNTQHKSIDIYCLDGSECMSKGGSDWDYYNVSLVTSGGDMASEIYTVLEKCKELKRLVLAGGGGGGSCAQFKNSNDIDGILDYINCNFDRYNKYESSFRVDVRNKTLIFANEMSTADPLRFSDIGFRLNTQHNSIDVYCLDGSECMSKGGSNWDFYNVSLVTSSGDMASEIHSVLAKCKELKRLVLGGRVIDDNNNIDDDNDGGGTGGTGSTENRRRSGGSAKSKAQTYLNDINGWYQNNGKSAYIWEIDWNNKRLIYSYDNCKCYVPLENTTIRYEYVAGQSPEPYGVDFLTNGDKYEYICDDGYSNSGRELNTYVNRKAIADDCIEAFKRIQNLVLYGRE